MDSITIVAKKVPINKTFTIHMFENQILKSIFPPDLKDDQYFIL